MRGVDAPRYDSWQCPRNLSRPLSGEVTVLKFRRVCVNDQNMRYKFMLQFSNRLPLYSGHCSTAKSNASLVLSSRNCRTTGTACFFQTKQGPQDCVRSDGTTPQKAFNGKILAGSKHLPRGSQLHVGACPTQLNWTCTQTQSAGTCDMRSDDLELREVAKKVMCATDKNCFTFGPLLSSNTHVKVSTQRRVTPKYTKCP